ncbi:23S rRNA (pseudouridine(1915)-N(3))-methyltransferase RlmH [Aliikangiella maris]|uniref:Ribosomal RNA large subunit methyltransferase H n=2 Tax=Aliikangiella maris TaxID=3162458 RepID=A0ABV3MPY2_9GAMM
MKIKLIAVGSKMPDWVTQGFNQYTQRMPRDCAVELIEIPLAKRSKNQLAEQWKDKEGQQILKAIDATDWVVALEVQGKNWSTQQLAGQLTQWQQMGNNVALLVGGPDGLSSECLARANSKWSLSALTLPHPLVRVLLAETLYRAWSVTVNHPYHRE